MRLKQAIGQQTSKFNPLYPAEILLSEDIGIRNGWIRY